MPQLPTITITDQAIWDRLFAAFHGDPLEYKRWLRAQLRMEVLRSEQELENQKATAAKRTIMNDVVQIRFDAEDTGDLP